MSDKLSQGTFRVADKNIFISGTNRLCFNHSGNPMRRGRRVAELSSNSATM